MPAIELKNVSKFYKWEHKFQAAVQNVNLTIQQGEFVFIIGSSGAGKSTLLNLISGQVDPDWGQVFLDGRDLRSGGPFLRRRRWRAMFGVVRQEPSLIRKRTVGENLAFAARGRGRHRIETNSQLYFRVKKVLGLVGVAGAEDKYPGELTLNESRRVELAKALINSPPILVIDEITANMEDGNIWDILQFLKELNHKGTTIIMVTHASRYVNMLRQRVITMVDGKVFGDVQKGRYGDIV